MVSRLFRTILTYAFPTTICLVRLFNDTVSLYKLYSRRIGSNILDDTPANKSPGTTKEDGVQSQDILSSDHETKRALPECESDDDCLVTYIV